MTAFPVRQAKVAAIQLYAQHVQEQLEPLAHGLAAQGYTPNEVHEAVESLRPLFDKGVEDVLRQVTVMGLSAGINSDDQWAEISVGLLRSAFDRPTANPAILIKELAAGLALMERAGVEERDGKLYLPGETASIVKLHWERPQHG